MRNSAHEKLKRRYGLVQCSICCCTKTMLEREAKDLARATHLYLESGSRTRREATLAAREEQQSSVIHLYGCCRLL